jgi:hypothetical protein
VIRIATIAALALTAPAMANEVDDTVGQIGDGLVASKKGELYPWLDENMQDGRIDVEIGINAALGVFGLEYVRERGNVRRCDRPVQITA